jgi:8-oxo-dGTP pyrophosphatase MutT (NUDIX family)
MDKQHYDKKLYDKKPYDKKPYDKKLYDKKPYDKTTHYHSSIKCGNCGIKGHVYSNCKLPVLSYGMILFKLCKKTRKPLILLVQRKDSLTYIEYIRGKYDISDKSYLQMMFNRMSRPELRRLLEYDMEDLWKQMWLLDSIKMEKKHFNEYIKSRNLFNKLKAGFNINCPSINDKHSSHDHFSVDLDIMKISLKYFVENSNSYYDTPEWGFPKGRRNFNESDIDASVREFEEETNLSRDNIRIYNNIFPFTEEFFGSNNVKYKHVYYLAKSTEELEDIHIDKNNIHQISEIGDIRWVSYDEALSLLRPYETTKIKTVKNIFKFIQNYTNFCGEY